MRKFLFATFALTVLPSMFGCACCTALWECEQQKNQWLKDHFCHHHKRVDPALAPLVAVPMATAVYPPLVAPAAQAAPYAAAPMAVCPPVAVCPQAPMCQPVCPPVVCPPVQQCCPPVQQCCPQTPVIYDPPGTCCEPMCCP
jgi:hypothetical protein